MHDSVLLMALLEAVPKLPDACSHPGHRPNPLHPDKSYDYTRCWGAFVVRCMTPRMARRGNGSNTTLGRHYWVVERTFV